MFYWPPSPSLYEFILPKEDSTRSVSHLAGQWTERPEVVRIDELICSWACEHCSVENHHVTPTARLTSFFFFFKSNYFAEDMTQGNLENPKKKQRLTTNFV